MTNAINAKAFFDFKSAVADIRITKLTQADIDHLKELLDNIVPYGALPQLTASQKIQLEQTISDLLVKQKEYLANLDSFGREDPLMTRMLADISSELTRLTTMITINRVTGPLTSMFN